MRRVACNVTQEKRNDKCVDGHFEQFLAGWPSGTVAYSVTVDTFVESAAVTVAGTTAASMTNVIAAIDQEAATFTTAAPVTVAELQVEAGPGR